MKPRLAIAALFLIMVFAAAPGAQAEKLKPFILGNTPAGDLPEAITATQNALADQGFEIVGSYAPYSSATIIVVTSPELKKAAAEAKNGGFGAGQRVAVTAMDGKLQVSYVNPAYLGTAYGLGKLEAVGARLKTALGAVQDFGSAEGIDEKKLGPGKYHYMMSMPYFYDIDELAKHADYQSAVATVEKNLAAGKGGTKKVYRIDVAGETSVFGVAIPVGDGPESGDKDTDQEIMDIVDFQPLRSTAYLPYELLVQGREIIALRGRYRIALHFPDTKMTGDHGFTKIMSSPGGILKALEAVASP